jgi:hypothetical protein
VPSFVHPSCCARSRFRSVCSCDRLGTHRLPIMAPPNGTRAHIRVRSWIGDFCGWKPLCGGAEAWGGAQSAQIGVWQVVLAHSVNRRFRSGAGWTSRSAGLNQPLGGELHRKMSSRTQGQLARDTRVVPGQRASARTGGPMSDDPDVPDGDTQHQTGHTSRRQAASQNIHS